MTRRGNIKRTRTDGTMTFLVKAEKLIGYTFQVTDNIKNYPKSVRFTLTNRIQDKALEIHGNLLHANEIYPLNRHELQRRIEFQQTALVNCKELDFFIRFSHSTGRIEDDQLKHWSALLTETRKWSAGWHKKDKERFEF